MTAPEPMPNEKTTEYSEAEISAAREDELAEEATLLLETRLRRMMALNIEIRRRDAQIEVLQERIGELQAALAELKRAEPVNGFEIPDDVTEEVIDGEVVDVGS